MATKGHVELLNNYLIFYKYQLQLLPIIRAGNEYLYGEFNIVSASFIGFGSDVQFAIKHKNLEKTTLIIIVCNFV